ncbi:hypothetical protein ACFQ0B_43975 [Nonomuraea thailandensis]
MVKARDDDGRAEPCVAAQARLAGNGFPCAHPITPVVGVGPWRCTRRSSALGERCCTGTRRTSPRATRRSSPG